MFVLVGCVVGCVGVWWWFGWFVVVFGSVGVVK